MAVETSTDRALTFALSEDYARTTGGFVYDSRLMGGLEARGWRVDRLTLPAGFPRPSPRARQEAQAALAALPDGALVLSDQLCFSVLPDVVRHEGQRLRLVTIVHHPLAAEGYGGRTVADAFHADEKAALAEMRLVVVTSAATAEMLLRDYQVPAARLQIAEPGHDAAPIAPGSGEPSPHLLSVGAVVPRKGHDLLVSALAPLAGLGWRLTIVGNTERTPEHVARVRDLAAKAGLGDRIALAGEISQDKLESLWSTADLFVSASRHEGYGMAIAEAIARALPVIATEAGAVGGWLGTSGLPVLPNGDLERLTHELGSAIGDARHRTALRDRALAFRSRLPSWEAAVRLVETRLVAI